MFKSSAGTDTSNTTSSSTSSVISPVVQHPLATEAQTATSTTALAHDVPNVDGFQELVSLDGTNYDPKPDNNNDDDDEPDVKGNEKAVVSASTRPSRAPSRVASQSNLLSSQVSVTYPELPLTMKDVVVKSELSSADSTAQQFNVVNAFNKDKQGNALQEKDFIVRNYLNRGSRVDPGTFKVFHLNNTPYLVGPSQDLVATARMVTFTAKNEELPSFKQDIPYFNTKGVHILNVPQGKLAKVTDQNKCKFYGAGVHVIHSQTLTPIDPKHDFVNVYQPIIQHGNLTILQVPIGKIAKVFVKNQPMLLEGRAEPYVFDDATFRIVSNEKEPFFNSTDQLITLGSIKRLLPRKGEVAVTYLGGQLVIIDPAETNGKAVIIDDPNHFVGDKPFLQTNINTITYPDHKQPAKVATTLDGVDVEMRLMITYTIPSAQKAIESLGNTESSPHDAILDHIERRALADMSQVIQGSNYYQAQETKNPRAQKAKPASTSSNSTEPSAPEYSDQHLQDKIKKLLWEELEAKGIHLDCLTFSVFTCTDKNVRNAMAENAKATQKANAEVALIDAQSTLSIATARRDAEVEQIKKQGEVTRAQLEVERSLVIAQGVANQKATVMQIEAQAELNAAKLRAQATIETAKAEAEAISLKARAELAVLAELFGNRPELLHQLLMAREQSKALSGIQSMVVSSEAAGSVFAVGTPAFFKPAPGVQVVAPPNARLANANEGPKL